MLTVILVAIVLIVTAIIIAAILRAPNASLENEIARLPDFEVTHRFDQPDGVASLLLDVRSRQIALATTRAPPMLFRCDRLVSINAERNGVELQEFGRTGAFGTGRHGTILTRFGLIVNEIAGPNRSSEPVSRLVLRLCVEDVRGSEHRIVFFEARRAAAPNRHEIMLAAFELCEWYERLLAITPQR